jgi:hypothetical protein
VNGCFATGVLIAQIPCHHTVYAILYPVFRFALQFAIFHGYWALVRESNLRELSRFFPFALCQRLCLNPSTSNSNRMSVVSLPPFLLRRDIMHKYTKSRKKSSSANSFTQHQPLSPFSPPLSLSLSPPPPSSPPPKTHPNHRILAQTSPQP